MKLISISLSGSIMILLILLMRQLFQYKVSRRVWLVLWFLVAARLLVPFSLPVHTEVIHSVSPESLQTAAAQTIVKSIEPAAKTGGVSLCTVVWLSGMILTLGYFIISHLLNCRKYRDAVLECELPKRVSVKRAAGIMGPLTYGVFRPMILLPSDLPRQSPAYDHVIAHELAHIRHFDIPKRMLLLFCLGVHWFNPLVWGMVYVAIQDMEMRCDRDAVMKLGTGQVIAYAQSLVEAEERKLLGYFPMGFSYSATGSRIKALSRGKSSTIGSVILCAVLAVILSVLFATQSVAAVSVPKQTQPTAIPQIQEPHPAAQEEAPIIDETPTASTEQAEPEPPEPEVLPEPEVPSQEVEEPEQPKAEEEPQPEPIPEPSTTPEPKPEPEPEPAPEPQPQPVIYAPDALSMAEGAEQTILVGTTWTELYSDNPSVVQVGGVYDAGGVYVCGFSARKAGTSNVFYQLNGGWYLFATVTVS